MLFYSFIFVVKEVIEFEWLFASLIAGLYFVLFFHICGKKWLVLSSDTFAPLISGTYVVLFIFVVKKVIDFEWHCLVFPSGSYVVLFIHICGKEENLIDWLTQTHSGTYVVLFIHVCGKKRSWFEWHLFCFALKMVEVLCSVCFKFIVCVTVVL